MKKLLGIFMVMFTLLFMTAIAMAQPIAGLAGPPTGVDEVLSALSALVGGVQGASTLVVVGLVAQLLAKFVLSPLWDKLGLEPKFKFLVFALSSVVGAVVPLMIQGQSLLHAVSSGAVLLLIVQYGHRIYELFIEKKEA